MNFETDYIKILKFAKNKAFGLQIEAEDLVNEAYLNLYDKPYSLQAYYNEISNQFLIEKHNTANDISYGDKGSTGAEFSGEYVCVCCKETKVASEFRVALRPFGKKELRTQCKECERNLLLSHYHRVKGTEKYKNYNKANFKKYLEKNRKSWNRYLKGRQKKDVENVTDAYVRRCIRAKYKDKELAKKYIEDKDFISNYREQLLAKRAKVKKRS